MNAMDKEAVSPEQSHEVEAPQAEVVKKGKGKKGGFGQKERVTIEKLDLATIKVTCMGLTPILMHRFSEKAGIEAMRLKHWGLQEVNKGKKQRDAKDPLALFAAACYTMDGRLPKVIGTKEDFLKEVRNGTVEQHAGGYVSNKVKAKGNFGIPFSIIKGAIIGAAAGTSISKADALRSIRIVEAMIPLKCSNPRMREDVTRVGPFSNRQPDLRYRPQFDEWEMTFHIMFNRGLLTSNEVLNLVNTAGFAPGICDWRPEKKGEFGRFEVKVS